MKLFFLLALIFSFKSFSKTTILPPEFIDLKTVNQSIIISMKYFKSDNFLAEPVEGYKASKCIVTKPAAVSLNKIQIELLKSGYTLKVFDCYRPQRAVDHFVRWAKDLQHLSTKKTYYPNIPKDQLFKLEYIALKSGHSRGSTVDLTLVGLKDKKELDMGTRFDFFDPLSNTMNAKVGVEALKNRLLLKGIMEKYGFKNYPLEWWHYTLRDEVFKDKYFDFIIQ